MREPKVFSHHYRSFQLVEQVKWVDDLRSGLGLRWFVKGVETEECGPKKR